MRKPDPRIYELTCELAGADPEAAVFLDDNADNVRGRGARSASRPSTSASTRSRRSPSSTPSSTAEESPGRSPATLRRR